MMKKERMKVLEMVEAGKISVEEATALLESLAEAASVCSESHYGDEMEERVHDFSRSVDTFARDFGERASETWKNCEPKLRSATKKVVEKTAHLMDEISKSLHESLKNMETNESGADTAAPPCDDDAPREN